MSFHFHTSTRDALLTNNIDTLKLGCVVFCPSVMMPLKSEHLFFQQPSTELEKKVAAILASSEHVGEADQELTVAEKKSLFQMTVEEVSEC